MQGWLKQSGSFSLSFDEWHKNNGKKVLGGIGNVFFFAGKAVKFMSKVLSRLLRLNFQWFYPPCCMNHYTQSFQWMHLTISHDALHSLITTDNNNNTSIHLSGSWKNKKETQPMFFEIVFMGFRAGSWHDFSCDRVPASLCPNNNWNATACIQFCCGEATCEVSGHRIPGAPAFDWMWHFSSLRIWW